MQKAIATTLLLFLFGCISARAQTHTLRYTAMTSKTFGYYEYLPQGYKGDGTAVYPLILFIHGNGERGSGDSADLNRMIESGLPKVMREPRFPTSFTVQGKVHRFIVIAPQFHPRPTVADVDDVLRYVLAHYPVDEARIYLTGFSMGGGACWDYAGSVPALVNKLAALVPVSGSGVPDTVKSGNIAAANLPVWATHNDSDVVVPVSTTHTYIEYINRAPAPTPAAKKTIFHSRSHNSWAATYNPAFKEANLNVFEWMLQYRRRPALPVGPKQVNVNLYGGLYPYNHVEWNNWNVKAPLASGTLRYADVNVSAVKAALSKSTSISDNDSAYGNSMAPAGVLRYTSSSANGRTLILKGLSASKTYAIELYASRGAAIGGSSIFTVNGTAVTINVVNNFSSKATFANIAPNASGQIVVNINKTASYNYINGFAITENATASSSAKYIRTNIYGGANPCTNAGWNNWNIGTVAATNITSSAFKYADGATSVVTATLSDTRPLVDNGATYGIVMAPAEVLRHASASDEQRTLTLSGLSISKTYGLALYASRKQPGGNSTIFTVNGSSQNISTYKNLTSKATFSHLLPDAQGRIIVTIRSANTYNYLNGFTLTEEAGAINQPPVANAGADKAITLPSSITLNGSGTDGDGAITAYKWVKTAGPTAFKIGTPAAAATTVSGLTEGIYIFRLTVTDNKGATAADEVQVTVKAATITMAIDAIPAQTDKQVSIKRTEAEK
jgi:dienelactone hydrolase